MTNYLGEIRSFAFGQIPEHWLPCNGQLLRISQNKPLFSLLGTVYGGDGQNTFALPDLRGRTPIHIGTYPGTYTATYQLGDAGGSEKVIPTCMPTHSHPFLVAGGKGSSSVSPATDRTLCLASVPEVPQVANENMQPYVSSLSSKATRLHPNTINPAGQTVPHENRMPYLTVLFCIATAGILPPKQSS
ncbi:MAG: tail fiber protein [Chitinophagaceae bacterium]